MIQMSFHSSRFAQPNSSTQRCSQKNDSLLLDIERTGLKMTRRRRITVHEFTLADLIPWLIKTPKLRAFLEAPDQPAGQRHQQD